MRMICWKWLLTQCPFFGGTSITVDPLQNRIELFGRLEFSQMWHKSMQNTRIDCWAVEPTHTHTSYVVKPLKSNFQSLECLGRAFFMRIHLAGWYCWVSPQCCCCRSRHGHHSHRGTGTPRLCRFHDFFLLITTISRCLHTLHWWQYMGLPWPSIF